MLPFAKFEERKTTVVLPIVNISHLTFGEFLFYNFYHFHHENPCEICFMGATGWSRPLSSWEMLFTAQCLSIKVHRVSSPSSKVKLLFLFFSDISVLSGMSFHTACSMSLIPVGLLFPLDLVRNNRIPNLTCIMPIKESSISFDIFTMIKLANRLKQEFEIAATNSIFNKSRLSP